MATAKDAPRQMDLVERLALERKRKEIQAGLQAPSNDSNDSFNVSAMTTAAPADTSEDDGARKSLVDRLLAQRDARMNNDAGTTTATAANPATQARFNSTMRQPFPAGQRLASGVPVSRGGRGESAGEDEEGERSGSSSDRGVTVAGSTPARSDRAAELSVDMSRRSGASGRSGKSGRSSNKSSVASSARQRPQSASAMPVRDPSREVSASTQTAAEVEDELRRLRNAATGAQARVQGINTSTATGRRPSTASAGPTPRRASVSGASSAENEPPPTATRPMAATTPGRSASAGRRQPTRTVPFAFSSHPHTRTAEELRAQVAAEEREHCTFKPNVNRGPLGDRPMSSDERFARLSTPKSVASRMKEKQLRDEEAMVECTFKPEIHRGDANRETAEPIGDRLMKHAGARKAHIMQLQREMEEEKLETFSFKPAVAADEWVDTETYQPIHLRATEVLRNKHAQLKYMQEVADEANPHLTFQPKINERSMVMAEKRGAGKADVVTRLTATPGARKSRSDQEVEKDVKEAERNFTFQPRISAGSQQIVESSDVYSQDFFARQSQLLRQSRERKMLLAKEVMQTEMGGDPDKSFQPKINPQRGDEKEETMEERITRLSSKDPEKTKELREAVSREYFDQFTFHPQLNRASMTMGKTHNFESLHKDEDAKRNRKKVEQILEDAFIQSHPFKPEVRNDQRNANVKNVIDLDDPEKMMRKLALDRKALQERLDKIKDEQQKQELAECTFQPKLNTKGQRQDKPVYVRGFSGFMERKELTERLQKDKAAREEAAFRVKAAAVKGKVPVPRDRQQPNGPTHETPARLPVRARSRSAEPGPRSRPSTAPTVSRATGPDAQPRAAARSDAQVLAAGVGAGGGAGEGGRRMSMDEKSELLRRAVADAYFEEGQSGDFTYDSIQVE